MRHIIRRNIALLLALVLLFSVCGTGAAAAENKSISGIAELQRTENGVVYAAGGSTYALQYGTYDESYTGLEYFYSDGYFAEDPAVYNAHLATMSMNMVEAGIPIRSGSHQSDGYTALLQKLGFTVTEHSVSEDYKTEPGTDTIGYAVAHKAMKTADGTDTGKVIVAVGFRSNGYGKEWYSNFLLGTSGDAAGFAKAAEKTVAGVAVYLEKENLTDELAAGNICFWVYGQSRGGSVANLTAKYLIDAYSSKDGETYCNPVYAYCAASCLCGTADGIRSEKAELYNGIHNLIFEDDPIAKLIPYLAQGETESTLGMIRYGQTHYCSETESALREELEQFAPGFDYSTAFSVAYIGIDVDTTDLSSLLSLLNQFTEGTLTEENVLCVSETEAAKAVTVSRFQDLFYEYLTEWEVSSRTVYSGTAYSAGGDLGSSTLETAFADLALLTEALSSETLSALSDCLKGENNGEGIMDVIPTSLATLSLLNRIQNWTEQTEAQKKKDIQTIWGYLTSCYSGTGRNKQTIQSILSAVSVTDKQTAYDILLQDFSVMALYGIDFASRDYAGAYNENDAVDQIGQRGVLLATLIYNLRNNGFSIAMNHYRVVYLAETRLHDSFYQSLGLIVSDGNKTYFAKSDVETANGIKTPSDAIETGVLTVYDAAGKVRRIAVVSFTGSAEDFVFRFEDTSLPDGCTWKLFTLDEGYCPVYSTIMGTDDTTSGLYIRQ